MTSWFKRWFGLSEVTSSASAAPQRRVTTPPLVMRTDTTLPIVAWEPMYAQAPAEDQPELLDEYWTAVAPLLTPEEMHDKHVSFWNEKTIQEFWSGKSWLRPDEANMLSYDLARHFVSMIARDYDAFRAFVNAADTADSGDAAALRHLGFPVGHLAAAMLGEGPWQPKPETWKEGVERGQFHL